MSEKIVQLNEEVIKGQIKELVRGSVEETLNELLGAISRLIVSTKVLTKKIYTISLFSWQEKLHLFGYVSFYV